MFITGLSAGKVPVRTPSYDRAAGYKKGYLMSQNLNVCQGQHVRLDRHPSRGRLRAVVVATAIIAAGMAPAVVSAGSGNTSDSSAKPLTLALIGDVPYGTVQEETFSSLINAVNDDPKVRIVAHVGDIKSGSTECTDERFAAVATAFATFQDPLIYTPGDNEWTDCHRVNNGSFDPLERLDAVRQLFFSEPGTALGRHPMRVEFEPTLVENVRWIESQVAFATLHVIGSNNGLAPWTGLGNAVPTPEQSAEVAARIDATNQWIDETFDAAEAQDLAGVVLLMQADTWSPTPASAQQAIVDRIAERTAAFAGKVLLIQGDSHTYKVDNPLGLDNFTRIVVHGETLPFEYLQLTVDPRNEQLFEWARVPVAG